MRHHPDHPHHHHHEAEAVPYIYDVDEASFQELVLDRSSTVPVLVDFWAEWCAPCIALTPTLDKVAREYGGRLLLAKVEVDDNMRLAGHYRLRGFPTIIVFRNSEQVERFSGNKPLHFIRELAERVLIA